jgi:hypothetical protein
MRKTASTLGIEVSTCRRAEGHPRHAMLILCRRLAGLARFALLDRTLAVGDVRPP